MNTTIFDDPVAFYERVRPLLLDEGKMYCMLFTDLANPTSNSIYRKIGYRPVCDWDNMRFW